MKNKLLRLLLASITLMLCSHQVFAIEISTEATVSTGIQAIDNTAALSTEIYTLDGIQSASLKKGINIIRTTLSNGIKKTMKIIVK